MKPETITITLRHYSGGDEWVIVVEKTVPLDPIEALFPPERQQALDDIISDLRQELTRILWSR